MSGKPTEPPTREVCAEERLIELLRILLSSDSFGAASGEAGVPCGANESFSPDTASEAERPDTAKAPSLAPLSEREEGRLYRLSKDQDLAHLILPAAERAGLELPSPYAEKYQKRMFLALYRDERMTAALRRVGEALSDAKIVHLPLKGAIMRTLYPESWQRTSCDMDILVHEEQLDDAVRALEAIGYRNEGREFHDVSMTSEDGLLLELHFNIEENIPTLDRVLDRVWEYALPSEEDPFLYRMHPSFFLFHLLAHMSYHFTSGGCGVRPFMDVFLYRRSTAYDEAELSALLSDASLTKFAAGVFRLCDVWFAGEEADELCREMEIFLLHGGVYGTTEQRTQLQCMKKKGRLGFILYRLFPPMRILSGHFPVLQKHPWLAPVFYVWRILRLLFRKDVRDRASRSLQMTSAMDEETVDRTKHLIEQLGL